MRDTFFGRFAKKIAAATGHPVTFIIAVATVIVWAVTGPVFGYSETWQLVINTGTTIVTFLMVFVIQHTQDKDTVAMQIKLDELIRANKQANNALLCMEDISDKELDAIRHKYFELAEEALAHLREGTQDDKKPDAVEDFGIAKIEPHARPKRKAARKPALKAAKAKKKA